MTETTVIELSTQALQLAAKLALPTLITSLVVGVTISLIQVVTQIQEMTLTFVPKLVALAAVLVVTGPWMIDEMTSFVIELWSRIGHL